MAGKVGFGGEVMKAKNGGGGIPTVQGQARRSSPGAGIRRQLKTEVGVSAKHIDFGNILSGRNTQKKKGCQSEVNKFFHVSCKRLQEMSNTQRILHGSRRALSGPALPGTTYHPGPGLSSGIAYTRLRRMAIIK